MAQPKVMPAKKPAPQMPGVKSGGKKVKKG
jgi:hypothetical protein